MKTTKAQPFDFLVSRPVLAEVFGVSEQHVSRLMKDGMLQAARGKFDLRHCVQWRVERSERAGPASDDTASAREALYISQRERIEFELSERRRELLPVELVDQTLGAIASLVSSQLDGLGPRMAGQLADMDDPAAVQSALIAECRAIRGAIAESIRAMAEGMGEEPTDEELEHDNDD